MNYNFTLIIPTHNRHRYLKRSIAYFKDLDAKVIYCDSSENAYGDFFAPNMEYLHLPSKKFAEKILIALNRTDTDFVALCADDDFIIIESLYKGEVFLEKYNNYKTVLGKYIAFNECFDGNYYNLYQELPKDINFSPHKNAEIFFENYYQILWAMYDIKVFTNALQIINEARFLNDNFIELVIGACACYQGGIKFQAEIWGVRELNVQTHWGARSPEIIKNQTIEFKSDYHSFKKLLDKSTTEGYADLVLSSYLKGQVSIKNILRKFIPNQIKLQIKKIRNLLFPLKKALLILNSTEEKNLDRISSILKYLD